MVSGQVSSYVASYSNAITHSTLVASGDKTQPSTALTLKTTSATGDANQKTIKMTASSTGLAWTAFAVFALFFIGALSTCLGACWGMSCKRED